MSPIESERGCRYRTVGGMYLVGGGLGHPCDRLDVPLRPCHTCGSNIKFSQGIQRIHIHRLLGDHKNCKCLSGCIICHPKVLPTISDFLMYVGSDYTPESFIKEVKKMGASKKIPFVPKDFKLGKSWILLAKKNLINESVGYHPNKPRKVDGIFFAFKPQRIEYLIAEKDATKEKLKELNRNKITPIIVKNIPENAVHFGRKSKGRTPKAKSGKQRTISLDGLLK